MRLATTELADQPCQNAQPHVCLQRWTLEAHLCLFAPGESVEPEEAALPSTGLLRRSL